MATTLDKTQAPPPAPPQTAPAPAQQPPEPLLVQCASCGAPIAFDQTYCLECGTRNKRSESWFARFKTRRYLLGGLGVLLAVGGIVGYAVAAASRHDAVKVATKSVAPPAPPVAAAPSPPPATPPPAAKTPPGKPIPPAGHAAVPPPHPSAPPAQPTHPAPAPSAPSHTSTTPSAPHHATPAPPRSTPKPDYAKLFRSGRNPVGAGKFDPNGVGGTNENSLSKVFDNDTSTVWKSGTYANGIGNGVGFYVDNGTADSIKGLGLLTKTPGFDVQIYAYNGDTPPQQLSDWTQVGTQSNAGQRNDIKLNLGGQQFQLYLVWFTKLPAKGQRFEIPEVQLLP
jgi:hypothetical protein